MKLLAVFAVNMVTIIGSSTASVILPFGPKQCGKFHAEARFVFDEWNMPAIQIAKLRRDIKEGRNKNAIDAMLVDRPANSPAKEEALLKRMGQFAVIYSAFCK